MTTENSNDFIAVLSDAIAPLVVAGTVVSATFLSGSSAEITLSNQRVVTVSVPSGYAAAYLFDVRPHNRGGNFSRVNGIRLRDVLTATAGAPSPSDEFEPNLEVTPWSSGCDLDIKRFYPPFGLSSTCPICGEVVTHDSNDYLSYPRIGEPIDVPFAHEVEDDSDWLYHEWSVHLVLGITATPCAPPVPSE